MAPGRTAIMRPSIPTQAPYTQAMPCFTATSLRRWRVSALSVPSRIKSLPTMSSALAAWRSRTIGSIVTSLLMAHQPIGSRYRLRKTSLGIQFIEEHLSLQIRQFDNIAVDNPQMSDAGAHELIGQTASQSAAPDQHGSRAAQDVLSRRADLREQNLSLISVQWLIETCRCLRNVLDTWMSRAVLRPMGVRYLHIRTGPRTARLIQVSHAVHLPRFSFKNTPLKGPQNQTAFPSRLLFASSLRRFTRRGGRLFFLPLAANVSCNIVAVPTKETHASRYAANSR